MEKTQQLTIAKLYKYSAILILLLPLWVTAQTQQGYVKTLGRPEKKGAALGGVTVRVKGQHNAILSKDDGTFSLPMTNMKNGDAYSLHQVQKSGYELNESDLVGRPIAFSDKVPLTIVMVSTEQLQADKQRIENNAYNTAEKNYKAKYNLLEKQLADNEITIEQYRTDIQDLQDKFEKYQSLIDNLAEHYAHTDYDFLDEKDREINLCIERGDLERADSLIRLLFDPIGVLQRNKEALDKLDMQIDQANKLLAQANEDMAAVLKQQEKDAEYLYQLYTIALARYDNEKAQFYIETRAALDTTNMEWQFDAGYYLQKQKDFEIAELYYLRAIEILKQLAKDDPQAQEPNLATVLHNLAILYYDTHRYAESEALYVEALIILKDLFIANPQVYGPSVAGTIDCVAGLYYQTHRYTKSESLFLEALEIYRSLAQENPQVYEPHVAMTLSQLALLNDYLGRYTESEALYMEALEINRRLAQANPQAYEPDLAMTLHGLAHLYKATRRFNESETMYLEALEIYRRSAQANPQVYEPKAAETLNGLASLYEVIGRLTESEALYVEALEIFRRLAQAHPRAYEPDLSETLHSLANLYEDIGRHTEREALYLEALEIRRRLAQENPQTYEPSLVKTLNNLADLYDDTQHYTESAALYEEALEIYRRLAQENPQAYEPALVKTLNSLAVLYMRTQHYTESEALYEEALEIYERLVKGNPKAYEPDMAKSHLTLGLLLYQKDQNQEAIRHFEASTQIYKELIKSDPSKQYMFAKSLYFWVHSATNSTTIGHEKCYKVYEQYLPIIQKQWKSDPANVQEDYASILGHLSLQCIFVTQYEKSERYARKALSIDASNHWIYSNLAAALLFQGKYDKAVAIYRQHKDELKDNFLDDIDEFEAAGVIPEERKADVERIRKMLNE